MQLSNVTNRDFFGWAYWAYQCEPNFVEPQVDDPHKLYIHINMIMSWGKLSQAEIIRERNKKGQ